MSKLYEALNKRTGSVVRMFRIENTRQNHYEVWVNNRTFSVGSIKEAYRLYNEALI